jgi:hypothetical protein
VRFQLNFNSAIIDWFLLPPGSVWLSWLCLPRQGCGIHFRGGGTHRTGAVAFSDEVIMGIVAGRGDPQLNVGSDQLDRR